MIPYFDVGPWRIGSAVVYPFGVMVGGALLTWLVVVAWRARRMGMDSRTALRLLESILVFGLAGALGAAWLYDALVPGAAVRYSSFGGAFGALMGAWIYFQFTGLGRSKWRYLDVLAYAFPFGWTCLRAGCVLVHDHPGRLTGSWLGVQYPGGTRFDLGLMEMLVSLAAACVFAVVGRRARTPGFFLKSMVFCGPIRLGLDTLRDHPAQIGGLTADQWGGMLLTVVSFWVWREQARMGGERATS